MDAAVSSSEAACCSVREDKSVLPAAISPEADAMLSTPVRMLAMVPARLAFMDSSACINWPISSRDFTIITLVRSLAATVRATRTAADKGRVMPRVSRMASSKPLTTAMEPIAIIQKLALR
ncbi:hypothetical protein G6F59_015812 [Rhizopus arrhizus]|nr:hypothetical protein G6F59_015812 [Rhizopus arrhizus]